MIRISKHFYIETAKKFSCHLSSNVPLMPVVLLLMIVFWKNDCSTDLLPLLLSPQMALCSRFGLQHLLTKTMQANYDRVERLTHLSVAPYLVLDRPRSRVALLLLIGS